jgi:hemerythrin
MRSLKWSTSNAVFVPELDDQHKEIFGAVGNLQKALARGAGLPELGQATQRLTACIADHFAHEERLMRAARYSSMRWHQQNHHAASKRVGQFVLRIEQGDVGAGLELVKYLISWLQDHTGLADRMLGAFLRNRQRSLFKLTFRAGTKPVDACAWVDSNGDAFDPRGSGNDG